MIEEGQPESGDDMRRPMAGLLLSAWRSPALRVAVALGLGGVAYAGGNLILARALPTEEFGRFALVLALVQIGIALGGVGADVVVNRHRLAPRSWLLKQLVLTSTGAAAALAVGAAALYDLDGRLLALMVLCTTAGACRQVAAAFYQSRERFGVALLLTQSVNLMLPVAGLIALAVSTSSAALALCVIVLGQCVSATIGWRQALKRATGSLSSLTPEGDLQQFPWREGLSIVGFVGAGFVLGNLDRLAIPRFLDLSQLALFSVVATVAGSPFQMLHVGIGYALLPRLRNSRSSTERRRILIHEAVVIAATMAVAATVVLALTPLIVKLFLADRYRVDRPLLVAVLGVGLLKPIGSGAVAVVNALGSAPALAQLSLAAWGVVAVSLAGAAAGARLDGLTGLVYGVGAGWLVRAVIAGMLAARCLREAPLYSPGTPAAAPPLAEE